MVFVECHSIKPPDCSVTKLRNYIVIKVITFMSTVRNSFPQSACLVIGNILRQASIQSFFLSVPVPVDLLVCVVQLLGKEVVANKREGLKMAEFEKCAFFKDIIKYHGNNDCYDDDDVEC